MYCGLVRILCLIGEGRNCPVLIAELVDLSKSDEIKQQIVRNMLQAGFYPGFILLASVRINTCLG